MEQINLTQTDRPNRSFVRWFRKRNAGGRLWTLLFFIPPALVIFSVFVVMPMFEASVYSVYKWNGIGELTNHVGLNNYKILSKNSTFYIALGNTLKVIAISLLIQLPLALCAALAIYKKSWSNTVFRLLFFVPYILAEIVAGLIWKFMFDGSTGGMSVITSALGLSDYYILGDKDWAFVAILVVVVWKYFGFHMMIFIAALQGIPNDLIEASRIDGASKLQTTMLVKIPLIKHAIILSVFFSFLGALQLFDLIIPLTNGGPSNTTHTIVSYLYTFGISRMKIGFGSATGVVLFIMCVVFAFTYQKFVMNKKG